MKAIGTIFRSWQDTMCREFVDSLVMLAAYSQSALCKPDEYIPYLHGKVSWFELMRQEAIDGALGEWILFLDTDHQFQPDMLERLLHVAKKHDAKVLSALYLSKHPPNHVPVANLWTSDGGMKPLLEWDQEAEIMEIGPCGAGSLLVYREVFSKIKKAFPREMPFSTIPGLSEDYSFFKRCRDIGIKTYLSPRIQSYHLLPRAAATITQMESKKDEKAHSTYPDGVDPDERHDY